MSNTTELNKLIAVPDYNEENYKELSFMELCFLRNTAEQLKNQNLTNPANGQFYKMREDFFYMLCKRRLQTAEALYVLMCQQTALPYIVCEEESFNDQVWMFDEESTAVSVAAEESKKRGLNIVVNRLENNKLLPLYISLYCTGVNELFINKGKEPLRVELLDFIKKPDFDAAPADKRPLVNPEILLTAAYFAQKMSSSLEEKNGEELRNLEEELLVNLKCKKVLVPVQVVEGADDLKPENLRFPLVRMQNGKQFQPICSDSNEFHRFIVGQERIRALTVPGEKLKEILVPDAEGIYLNPMSVKLAIPKFKL